MSLTDSSEIVDDRYDAEQTMLRNEKVRRMHDCLAKLDRRQSKAIRTAFFDGYTYAELAEYNEVPLGTMKSWIRRGLGQIREYLDADAPA